MMRRHWWKALGVLLVLYGIVAGMLVPLGPNVIATSRSSATLGETFTVDVTGYNTSFLGAAAGAGEVDKSGDLKAWLLAKPLDADHKELFIPADNVSVTDDRNAGLTFTLPVFLPDVSLEKTTLSIVMNNSADGFFVHKDAIFVRQETPAANRQLALAPWSKVNMREEGLASVTRTTFPFDKFLQETIRNTYFHVSLWFAMIFIFIAAFVYAIKYLARSKKASNEGINEVSLRDKADYWSVAFTAVGLTFGVLGLLTGAVWAKYTWNSWWTWDPKQTTTLIALLIYAGYFVLRAAIPDHEQRARVSASYNIFAFACLIPLIYILPRLIGNSLHPGVDGNPALSSADLDDTMRMVFYPIIIGWTLFGFWMATVSYRVRILGERLQRD